MYPRLERNGKMVPRGELNTKVSPTQDRDAENRVFIGGSAIFLQNN